MSFTDNETQFKSLLLTIKVYKQSKTFELLCEISRLTISHPFALKLTDNPTKETKF